MSTIITCRATTTTYRGNGAWSGGEDSHGGGDEEELHFIIIKISCV